MNLVKESISFQRGNDPKNVLGIGQRHLIEAWMEEMDITNYFINDDMTIDADRIFLKDHGLTQLPDYIQFNIINGYFNISYNELTTLRGCPIELKPNPSRSFELNFRCNNNKLTSLEYCPKKIGGEFHCGNNYKSFSKRYVTKYCKVNPYKIFL